MAKKKIKVRVCPKCESSNIIQWLGGKTGQYKCKNCGYIGALIIEKDVEYSDNR